MTSSYDFILFEITNMLHSKSNISMIHKLFIVLKNEKKREFYPVGKHHRLD